MKLEQGLLVLVLLMALGVGALLGAFGWGTFGAALVPAVAIGLNWKRATPFAACVAITSSLIVNFGVELFDIRLPWECTAAPWRCWSR